jgi:catechol 2,3-dioxygenase-like lactoylglutathione lyase family enzyme
MKLEAVVLPTADVNRTKAYYETLGWQVDVDYATEGLRVVQMTPPGSYCSIVFGAGIAAADPGSAQGLILTVTDIEAARAELTARGVEVSEIFHDGAGAASRAETHYRAPGLDPERRNYASFASFADPDGNSWQLREITSRSRSADG